MRLHSLKTRGVGMPFRSAEVSIDFDALPDGLVALVGDNGSGKSHLLELSGPATLYRQLASYGESFLDHVAPGVRDAFSELVFSLGPERFRALVQSDPSFGGGRGKNEALLFRQVGGDWTPVAGPLVREYDDAIGKILPSTELFLASVFACQGGEGSFFGLAKSARKDLFGSMLGLAHLQEKSEQSRGRAQTILQRLDRVREDIAAASARAERCNVLSIAIETKAETLAALDAQLAQARKSLEAAQTTLSTAKDELAKGEAEAAATARDRARIETERDQAQQRVGALTVRLEQITETLASAEAVRSAAARVAKLDEEIRALQQADLEAAERRGPVETQVVELEAQRTGLLAEHQRLSAELEKARFAAARVAEAAKLEREMAEQREQLRAAQAEVADCEQRLPELEAAASEEANQAEKRRTLEARQRDLAPRKELLSQIPGAPECEGCPLTANARDARDALAKVEAELALAPQIEGSPARDALQALRDRLRIVEGQRALAQAWIAENAPKLERLALDREEAGKASTIETEMTRISGEGSAVRADLDQAKAQASALAEERGQLARELAQLRQTRQDLAASAAKLEQIAAAEAQKAEVEESLSTAKGSAMAAAAALAELPDHDLAPARERIATAALEVSRAGERGATLDADAALVRGELAKLTGEREALGSPSGDLAALQSREQVLVRDASDWALLEKALGRDGVQALAIDAAGPSVSALANDLLSACYGPRFSLSLETTAQTKDGKKQREVFDIRILDADAGREAKQGSGGEMVLLDESLRLALAIFNTQRSGVPLRTLWRDETTGALSPENADRYVSMLRRAMELGGFERCLFIAHAEAVWQQADARIFIANGAVSFDEQRAAA